MTDSKMHEDIVYHLPRLSAHARRLVRDRSLADDLVQDTVERALRHADQFQAGTNLQAWLTTILRNTYFNELRRLRRLTPFGTGDIIRTSIGGEQEGHVQLCEFQRAFGGLSPAQREALSLVITQGFTYEQASRAVGCAVGTIKSRISRARLELQAEFEGRGSASGSLRRSRRACGKSSRPKTTH